MAPPRSPKIRSPLSGKIKDQQSKVTNGSALLLGVDGRSPWVRRAKDIIASHLSDLGGDDVVSAAERSIVRRASCLTVELEKLETKFALAGEASSADLDLYIRASGNLRRLLQTIGLERRAKDIGVVVRAAPPGGTSVRAELAEVT